MKYTLLYYYTILSLKKGHFYFAQDQFYLDQYPFYYNYCCSLFLFFRIKKPKALFFFAHNIILPLSVVENFSCTFILNLQLSP